jgi:RNA polymerase sigma-70 factor (ECF subfamily)
MDDFDAWYGREHPRVLAACTALSGDLGAAQEATDEAFTRALERWSSVGSMTAPGGWVQTVALNHLRRGLRRRGRERMVGMARRPDVDTIPDVGLWLAVATLPPRQQTAVVLAYVHDLPGAGIAAVMGISPGTVSSTLDAARRGLRRRLDEPATTTEAAR